MNSYPNLPNMSFHVSTWEEAELLELYRECDDEWRGFVMMSALAASEQHNGHAPPGFVLVEGRAGGDTPPPPQIARLTRV